jgi:diguanylate cyclase (GGDEF)-like protein
MNILVPLKTKDRVEGVLDLSVPVGTEPSEYTVKMLATIGNQLGIAIENARLYEKTKERSLLDSLTGLWNHEEIVRILEQELDRAKREGTSVGVIMIDLDHFKRVNDTYGHLLGDAVLQKTAEKLRSMLRSYEIVGRYGGEEFLLVLPGCGLRVAGEIAERIRKKMAAEVIDTPAGHIAVTLSLGVAVSSPERQSAAPFLVNAADLALYRAKKNGRNRMEFALDDETCSSNT